MVVQILFNGFRSSFNLRYSVLQRRLLLELNLCKHTDDVFSNFSVENNYVFCVTTEL